MAPATDSRKRERNGGYEPTGFSLYGHRGRHESCCRPTGGHWLRCDAGRPVSALDHFSRHLQCLTTQEFARQSPYETGVIIGEASAEAGFGAINLTVRNNGHVEPEIVTTNLEPMLRGIRSTGTHCDHITSSVLNLQSEYAEDVLTTAADNGVRYYRWGTFRYDHSATAYGDGFVAQLDQARGEAEALAAYNAKLGLSALYHTYSGDRLGASTLGILSISLMVSTRMPSALILMSDICSPRVCDPGSTICAMPCLMCVAPA